MIELTPVQVSWAKTMAQFFTLLVKHPDISTEELASKLGYSNDWVKDVLKKWLGSKVGRSPQKYDSKLQARMRELINSGKTYSVTAQMLSAEFSVRITKDAVCGWIFRNGRHGPTGESPK